MHAPRRTITGRAASAAQRPLAVLTAVALVATMLVLPAVTATAQAAPDLRISEFSSAGPGGSSDDFIELVNLGDATASLEGWQVYRCAGTGSRVYDPQIPTPADGPSFAGVTIAPGETFVLANASASAEVLAVADVTYATSLADGGSGVWLADPDEVRVDSVAMYGIDQDSECGIDGGMLPNVLDYGRDQTYQRVATTGDNATDFVAAARTPGTANATEADPGVQPSDVLITELNNGGPAGSSDNFVEVSNRGDATVDLSGWRLSRCTASGIRLPSTVQATVPDGTALAPGASFVFAHPVVTVPAGVAHVRYSVSLANAGFGAILEDADAVLRDAVGVFDTVASPCTQGTAAPNTLDFGFDETWQRRTDTGDNAADFHVRTRTLGEDVVPDPADDPVEPTLDGPVRISELTNADVANGAADDEDFFELANYGDVPVDIGGWDVHRCQADGRRAAAPQVTVADGTTLAPGETYLAARAGGPLVGDADATYGTSFASTGFGLVAYDADGIVVDRVASYGTTGPVGGPAITPCTNTLHLTTHLDTARGMSWQRLDTTGVDADDFVEAPRSPGSLPDDLRRPEERSAEELAPVAVDPRSRPLAATDLAASVPDDDGEVTLTARAAHATGEDHLVTVRAAERLPAGDGTAGVTGTSVDAPPTSRVGEDETPIAPDDLPIDGSDAPPLVTTDGAAYPYQRYELAVGDVDGDRVEVTWSGTTTGANELQLYAWDHDDDAWTLLDAAGGRVDEGITLLGRAEVAATVRDGQLDVLVQDGPRTGPAFQDSDAGLDTFADPSTYDGAMVHLTDTQFLAESHRDVFADMIQWILQFEVSRRIDYSIHTGDIIETWLNGTHLEAVARDEFASASEIMAMLDDAGHPYGILPGNHDDKWGRDKTLYDEFFPLDRYEDNGWFGGSFPEGTYRNHFDIVDVGGKELLDRLARVRGG